ncbi:hypothetical protein AB0E78_41535 [Streptomyces sp. NPDC032198]|uniref:hypothetical protein n=1 Tax=unclassified Streptomyces TaxID=2593676 RepID=UPI0033C51784
MTSSPGGSSIRWLLEATCQSAHASSRAWDQQIRLLGSVGAFDQARQVWVVRIGALDARALETLQTLYTAAGKFGTSVNLAAVVAPEHWQGPVFSDGGELARRAAADADRRRPLGQLLAP